MNDTDKIKGYINTLSFKSKFTSVIVANFLDINRGNCSWVIKDLEKHNEIVKTGEQGIRGAYYYRRVSNKDKIKIIPVSPIDIFLQQARP